MNLIKKISIIIVCITLFSFVFPKNVNAAEDDGLGGTLLNPVLSLVVSLGDGAMSLLQKVVLNIDNTVVNIDTSASWWSKIIVGVVIGLAAVVTFVACVASRGNISNSYRSS